jgi:ppGpp synthetase/RelA/SpoT-type nucleotidyltranferase
MGTLKRSSGSADASDNLQGLGSVSWAVDRLSTVAGVSLEPAIVASIEFAYQAHAGQTRRTREGPPVPYFVHPVEVAVLAAQWSGTIEAPLPPLSVLIPAAILHDTVEDTAISVVDLEAQFGPAVTQLVLGLSKPRLAEKETNEERASRFAKQIAAAGNAAIFLKCCDLMHNVAELDTTPTVVLAKAVQKGLSHYLPLLDHASLGERFRTAVKGSLDRAQGSLAVAGIDAIRTPLNRILARPVTGKTEAHDAIQLLHEIDGRGRAIVIKYPRCGSAVVVAGDVGVSLDARRLELIRSAAKEQGGATKIRSSLLETCGFPASAGAYACWDCGFDSVDTVLVWLLPDEWMAKPAEGTPPEIILRLVLSAAMRSSAELYRDLAMEAMEHGMQLSLPVACDLGIERGQLTQLVRWRNMCEQACIAVEAEFRAFLHIQREKGSLWHRVRTEYRVKTCKSILSKFRNSSLAWPEFAALKDIAGVRIICPTEWHTNCLVSFLEESRGERPVDGPIVRYDLEPTLHGYRGIHAIRLVRVRNEQGFIPCEVQIRTLIQDAWSTLSHAVAYKSVRKTGSEQRRALRALASALAECDKAAAAIFGQVDK